MCLFTRPIKIGRQTKDVVGADVIVFTEFYKIRDRRRIMSGFISCNLHLMIAESSGELPLCFIVIYSNVNHALYHAISSFS